MLRDLIVNSGNAAPAIYKASADCHTGMGVIKDVAAGTVAFPEAETAADICVLQKARVVSGDMAARTEFSDYDPAFNEIAEGDLVVLYTYDANERFATDQYNATTMIASNAGKRCSVGTDGKWTIAGSSVDSKYVFAGLHNDAGHTLAAIVVVDTPAANA